MEFRKMVMITLYARQQKRHRDKEQTLGLCKVRVIEPSEMVEKMKAAIAAIADKYS